MACDVRTRFVDAAELFGPQKGATPAQVKLLRRRLERLAQVYLDEHGVDVQALEGSGAAGGLAGGLAAVGAELVSGFDVVADELGLDERLEGADLVVTGEGFLDDESFDGKVVGGVASLAEAVGVPCLAVVGEVVEPLPAAALGPHRGVAHRALRCRGVDGPSRPVRGAGRRRPPRRPHPLTPRRPSPPPPERR